MIVQTAQFSQPLRAGSQSAPAAAPAPSTPTDKVDLSGLTGLPRLVLKTGEGLAKLGGWGGAALGAGLGVAVNGGLSQGFFLPLISAFLIGTDAAKARSGQQVLEGGFEAVDKAIAQRKEFTPARGAASTLTIVAACAELAAGFAIGGPAGILLAAPAMLGTAYVMGRAASQVESAVVEQLVNKKYATP